MAKETETSEISAGRLGQSGMTSNKDTATDNLNRGHDHPTKDGLANARDWQLHWQVSSDAATKTPRLMLLQLHN